MIVDMRKVTVLFLDSDRERTLEALYDLGVVHLLNPEEADAAAFELLESEDLQRARESLETVRDAVTRRKEREAKAAAKNDAEELEYQGSGKQEAAAEEETASEVEATLPSLSGPDLLEEAERLTADRKQAEKTRDALAAELERVGPLGEFDPALVTDLQQQGLFVKWLRAPANVVLTPPPGAVMDQIGADEKRRYYVIVSATPFELTDVDPPDVADEMSPPERRGGELRILIEEREREIGRIDDLLFGIGSRMEELEEAVAEVKKIAEIAHANASVGSSERISYLQGYIPAEDLPALRQAAIENGWGVTAREPDPTERVPTLLRYPRAIRPIRVLFSVLRIAPDYWETDVSWAFLVFFTVFVGLLVSDAGYGVLIFLLSVYLIIRTKGVRNDTVGLLLVLSLSVIFFGALSGSWLGLEELPGFLKALQLNYFTDQNNVMDLCFMIGAVHMTLAHLWTAITVFPQRGFLAQLGWMAIVWSMFFIARALVLERPFYSPVLYVLAGGVVLVIGFLMPFSRMREHLMEYFLLPLTLVGFFVDVISYIRLFAVGVASVAVAESFNGMAASVGFGFPGIIFAILIIVFGHSLNLALALLAVLVHGVRLNTLEFSAHKGLSWSGFGFRPFGRGPRRETSGAS